MLFTASANMFTCQKMFTNAKHVHTPRRCSRIFQIPRRCSHAKKSVHKCKIYSQKIQRAKKMFTNPKYVHKYKIYSQIQKCSHAKMFTTAKYVHMPRCSQVQNICSHDKKMFTNTRICSHTKKFFMNANNVHMLRRCSQMLNMFNMIVKDVHKCKICPQISSSHANTMFTIA